MFYLLVNRIISIKRRYFFEVIIFCTVLPASLQLSSCLAQNQRKDLMKLLYHFAFSEVIKKTKNNENDTTVGEFLIA